MQYQTRQSAGLDLPATESCSIYPGQRALLDTGVYLKDVLPEGIPGTAFAMVVPRSGLAAKYGLTVLNSPGIVDLDYLGKIHVNLINLGKDIVNIQAGDRIAQLVFCSAYRRSELVKDEERTGGHGSTGQ
jgi:dUTP pyrophosphatase